MFRLIDKADENRGYVTAAIYSSKDRITGMLIDDVNQLTTFWDWWLCLTLDYYSTTNKNISGIQPNYVLFFV